MIEKNIKKRENKLNFIFRRIGNREENKISLKKLLYIII